MKNKDTNIEHTQPERTTGYRVRLSEAEKQELHQAAGRAGLELSNLIRALPQLVDSHLATGAKVTEPE